ncbi:hypothetical protein [Pantoea sp. 18069]|uniref:hypothetical protein n=1 Tax=Pantoea sp. 18069 TaxID=2681415 RepID=UPI0013569E95|nr:hypothetical protein [Pantoea sp. 18069]
MSIRILLSLSVLSLSLLQACGGDGGSGGDAAPAALTLNVPAAEEPAAADIGAVSARFVANENARSILLSKSAQSIGSAVPTEQADSGAMVRIGSKTLSGDHQTVDIAGDAHFALGRWVKGTLTRDTETVTLQGQDHESYHYIVYNRLAALPLDGQLQCESVAATAPTALSDTHQKLGSASGSASVSFDPSGAVIQGTMQVHAGAQSASVDLSTAIQHPPAVSATGRMFANGPGAAIVLANLGDAVPGLVVGYRAQLPGGDLYLGVARFTCTPM